MPTLTRPSEGDVRRALDVVIDPRPDHPHREALTPGLAAEAGYRGTFRHEADQDLDELRATFQRKAHTAAMERALTALLRSRSDLLEADVAHIRLGDLPDDDGTAALLRRRLT